MSFDFKSSRHVAQFFKVLHLMELPWADRLENINFGLVQGMSTRRGTVKFLDEMLDSAKEAMHEKMKAQSEEKYAQIIDPETTSDLIGITGIKVQDMAAKRINGYVYSEERMLSYDGDTGPYLQYAHVRLCSVERKAAPEIVLPPHSEILTQINTDHLSEKHARDIVFLLALYPDIVKNSFKENQASTLVTYLFKLTHAISSAWETIIVKVKDDTFDIEVAKARLFLYCCARDVLNSGMKLLTLTPLERM